MTNLITSDRDERAPLKLWNRTHATERLVVEMTRAREDARHQFSILLVEFEGLSDITDRLGHASGQDVWRRVLGVLVQDLSSQDLCCRLSGDEFLLILPAKGQPECIEARERIRRCWNPGAGSREAAVKVNIGIASCSGNGSTVHTLLGSADESLHAYKLMNESAPSEPWTPAVPTTVAKDRRRTSEGRASGFAAAGKMVDRSPPLTIRGAVLAHPPEGFRSHSTMAFVESQR